MNCKANYSKLSFIVIVCHKLQTIHYIIIFSKIIQLAMEPLRYCKILIVDDSAAFREKIRYVLTDAEIGYYYYEAVDGREAVSQYITNKPDVVIMDLMMPNVDGLSAIKAIKKYDPDAKIIVASTRENKELVQDSIKGGVKDYIIKPFQPGAVVMAVSKALVATKEYKEKKAKPVTFIDKPLLYKGVYHGHVVNVSEYGEYELSANQDPLTKKLLQKAHDIKDMGKHYELVL